MAPFTHHWLLERPDDEPERAPLALEELPAKTWGLCRVLDPKPLLLPDP